MPIRQSYDMTKDPYVNRKRAIAAINETAALEAAVREFQEWDSLRQPGDLLRIWGNASREQN